MGEAVDGRCAALSGSLLSSVEEDLFRGSFCHASPDKQCVFMRVFEWLRGMHDNDVANLGQVRVRLACVTSRVHMFPLTWR